MADTKLTQLATLTSLSDDDLILLADNVATTPVNKSARLGDLRAYTSTYYDTTAAETAASKTPTDFQYEPGDPRRFGKTESIGAYTLNVPTDFATLQLAVDLGAYRKIEGSTTIINIETGHTLTDGLVVQDGDYSHIRIRSYDATVSLNASYSRDYVIQGTRAAMPVLETVINVNHKTGVYWGYEARFQSDGEVISGAGVINCDGSSGSNVGACLRVRHNSRVTASGSVFTGGNYRNVWVTRTSTLTADSGVFTGCLGDFAIFVSRGSTFYGDGVNGSGSAGGGLRCARSTASAQNSNFSNAAANAVVAFRGGVVSVNGSNLSNAGINGIVVSNETIPDGGAFVDAADCTINDSGAEAIYALGGVVEANFIAINGNTAGSLVRARYGARISVQGGTIINGNVHNIRAEDGGHVVCVNATVTGAITDDLSIARGSFIYAQGCTTTIGTGAPDEGDTTETTFNTISARGVIFAN